MKINKYIAPAAAATILLTGCGESGQEGAQTAATEEQATLRENQINMDVEYYPNGSREITPGKMNGDYPGYPRVLQFCFDTDTVQVQTRRYAESGGGIAFTDVETACEDMRLTPEDNLAVPGELPG